MSRLALILCLWGRLALADDEGGLPVPEPQTGPPSGIIAVAIVFPPDVEDVWIVGQVSGGPAVMFSNDGSYTHDHPDDGEWWGVLQAMGGSNEVRILGRAAGRPLRYALEANVPAAWISQPYPVTLLARPEGDGWAFTRVLMQALPPPGERPGAGLSQLGSRVGLSPTLLYLVWGGLLSLFTATAVLRGAILRVRAGDTATEATGADRR